MNPAMAEDTYACSTLSMPDLPSPIPASESISSKKSVQVSEISSMAPPDPGSDGTSDRCVAPKLTLPEIDSQWQPMDSANPAWPSKESSGEVAMSFAGSTSMISPVATTDPTDMGQVPALTYDVSPTAPAYFCPFKGRFLPFDTLRKPVQAEILPGEPRVFQRVRGKRNTDLTKTRMSKYVHTQPLYQVYWSQQTEVDSTDGGVGFRVDLSLSLAGLFSSSLLSPPEMSPRHSAFSFWQEMPRVKESGLLKTISHKERLLQEAVFEVLTSEASYLRSLSVAVNHFQKSYTLAKSLHATDVQTLFSNLQEVKEVSKRFLLEMEEHLERDVFLSGIGDLVLKHCPSFHKVYVPYVANQMFQERLMQQLMQDNLKFVQVLQMLEQQPVCQRQTLKSFLVLPFQRITRLKILLESILKRAVLGSPMAESVEPALKAVTQIVSECNERVGRMKHIEELVQLEKRVHFLTTKSLPLISQDRWLLRHGALTEILWHETTLGHKTRISSRPVYLHLFSDLLLTSRTENDQFLVEDYAALCNVEAKQFNSKVLGLPPAAFHLCLQRSSTGCNRSFVLVAASESEKQQWLMLLSRPAAPIASAVASQAKKESVEHLGEKYESAREQTVDPSLCVEAVSACEPNPRVSSRPPMGVVSLRAEDPECIIRVAESWARWCGLCSIGCTDWKRDYEPRQSGVWSLKYR